MSFINSAAASKRLIDILNKEEIKDIEDNMDGRYTVLFKNGIRCVVKLRTDYICANWPPDLVAFTFIIPFIWLKRYFINLVAVEYADQEYILDSFKNSHISRFSPIAKAVIKHHKEIKEIEAQKRVRSNMAEKNRIDNKTAEELMLVESFESKLKTK